MGLPSFFTCLSAEDCQRQGIAFLPLVVESMGGWHATAERQVKKLGSCLARHTGQSEEEAISHLWERLGILLQRGNAAMATLGCTYFRDQVPVETFLTFWVPIG